MDDSSLTKHRDSGIEALRIVSMLLIILHHFSIHTPWNDDASFLSSSVIDCFAIGGKVGVDVFVIITGYYQSKSVFKSKSILRTCIQVYVYAVLCLLLYIALYGVPSHNMITRSLFPLLTELNWFVPPYLLLYCLSPILNKLLKPCSAKVLNRMVLIGFMILSVIPTFIGQSAFDANIIWFIYLYVLGATIRKSSENGVRQGRNFITIIRANTAGIFVLCLAIECFFIVSGIYLNRTYGTDIDTMYLTSQSSIITVLLSIALFQAFSNSDMGYSSAINKIARSAFCVYLIHDNPLIRENWRFVEWVQYLDPLTILFTAPIICLSVFCVCTMINFILTPFIEYIHQYISQKIKLDLDRLDDLASRLQE